MKEKLLFSMNVKEEICYECGHKENKISLYKIENWYLRRYHCLNCGAFLKDCQNRTESK